MSLKRNTGYNLAGAVFPALVALATIPLYLPWIGSERFGALSLIWLISGSFGFFDLGLTRSTAFRIAAQPTADTAAHGKTLGSALALGSVASIVGGLFAWAVLHVYFERFFICGPELRDEILDALPLGGLLVAATLLSSICNGALQGRERFGEANILMTGGSAGLQAAPLMAAMLMGSEFSFLVAAMLGVRIATLAYGLFATSRHVAPLRLLRHDRSEVARLRGFGKWVMSTSLLGPIILYFDRLLLGSFFGGGAVASYNAPFQLAQRVTLVPTAIAAALFPRMVGRNLQQAADQCRIAADYSAALITPLVVLAILSMDWFIRLWVGEALSPDTPDIAKLLLAAFWCNSFGAIYATALEARGRPDVLPKLLLAEAPIYVAVLYVGARLGSPLWVAGLFGLRSLIDTAALWKLSRLPRQIGPLLLFQLALVIGACAFGVADGVGRSVWWMVTLALLIACAAASVSVLQRPALSAWDALRRKTPPPLAATVGSVFPGDDDVLHIGQAGEEAERELAQQAGSLAGGSRSDRFDP